MNASSRGFYDNCWNNPTKPIYQTINLSLVAQLLVDKLHNAAAGSKRNQPRSRYAHRRRQITVIEMNGILFWLNFTIHSRSCLKESLHSRSLALSAYELVRVGRIPEQDFAAWMNSASDSFLLWSVSNRCIMCSASVLALASAFGSFFDLYIDCIKLQRQSITKALVQSYSLHASNTST